MSFEPRSVYEFGDVVPIPAPDPRLRGGRAVVVASVADHVVKDLRARGLVKDPAAAQVVVFQTVADCLYGSRAIPEPQP
jgi:hypothetical protein